MTDFVEIVAIVEERQNRILLKNYWHPIYEFEALLFLILKS